MNKVISIISLLFTAILLFSPDVRSQHIYRYPMVKKITRKEYKKLLEKEKTDKQSKNRPFVYRWI